MGTIKIKILNYELYMKRNLFILILGIIFLLTLISCGISKNQMEQGIKKSFQEKIDTDLQYKDYGMKVQKVTLIKTSLNNFEGFVTVSIGNNSHDVSIIVKTDGTSYLWETKPMAFIFLMQYIDILLNSNPNDNNNSYSNQIINNSIVKYITLEEICQKIFSDFNIYNGFSNINDFISNSIITSNYNIKENIVKHEIHGGGIWHIYEIEWNKYYFVFYSSVIDGKSIGNYKIISIKIKLDDNNYLFPYRNYDEYINDKYFGNILSSYDDEIYYDMYFSEYFSVFECYLKFNKKILNELIIVRFFS